MQSNEFPAGGSVQKHIDALTAAAAALTSAYLRGQLTPAGEHRFIRNGRCRSCGEPRAHAARDHTDGGL